MKIIGVATMIEGVVWAMPKPNRHHNIIRWLAGELNFKKPVQGTQGFYTDTGEFLDRKQAHALALANGQCKDPDHPRELFSEDLW